MKSLVTPCQYLKMGYISTVSVHKIGNDYYNTTGIMEVLDELDARTYSCLALGDKLTKTETLMLDVLIGLAGFRDREDFAKAINTHNTTKENKNVS